MDTTGAMFFFAWTVPNIWAPIHEFGHLVFGWITLNPTFMTSWNTSGAFADTLMVRAGGYFTEIAFFTFIGWKFREKWYGLLVAYPFWTVFMQINSNQDISNIYGYATYLKVFWYYSLAIGVVFVLLSRFIKNPKVGEKILRVVRSIQDIDDQSALKWIADKHRRE